MNSYAISSTSLLRYGFIAMPLAFAGFPLYILAPDFYATHHGLSLTLLGSLLLCLRLFDAVQDPVIGWFIDKLQGSFLLITCVSAVILCLSIFGLFNIVLFSPALWLAACTFLAVNAYSILTIILGAQATLWTTDKNEQTRIAGTREAFGLVGLITAVSLPTALSHMVNPDEVYAWYAGILAFVMAAAVFAFSKISFSGRHEKNPAITKTNSILLALQALPKESKKLFVAYGISMIASSIPAVLVIFYVRDLLGAEYMTGMFLMLYFLSGAIGMPLWKKLSEYSGKHKAWACSNLLAVVGFVGAFFLSSGDVWLYAIVCIVSGLSFGADLTLPPSILADHIHARSNTSFSATHYSFLAFISKASLAIASAVALPALDAAGFRPQIENTQTALLALSTAYALIPCVLKLMAAGLLYIFFIRSQSGGDHETVSNLSNHRSDFHA